MLSQVVGVIVYTVYLLAPGLLVCNYIGWRRNKFFLAYGISLSILVLSQIPFRLWSGEVIDWYLLVHGIYLLIFAVGFGVGIVRANQESKRITRSLRFSIFGVTGVIVSFTIYHLYVGPYTEIPSDFWTRLGHVTEQVVVIKSGQFVGNVGFRQVVDDTAYIPFLHALVSHHIGVLPLKAVSTATLSASLLFLIATYWFTLRLIARVRINTRQKVAIACLSVVLTVVTFGVATFSYVRYYAYFPHIFNATLMLAVISIYLDYLEKPNANLLRLFVVVMFLLAMIVINQQEALMVLIVLAAISIWKMLKSLKNTWPNSVRQTDKLVRTGSFMIAATIVGLTLGFLLGTPGPWGKPHLFNLGELLPLLDGWPIANPTLRFWDTVGLFGVVVYAWYVCRMRWFTGLDYINVAMFSPIVLLFNPVFVLWFLYVASWDPLWRLAYLIPLPIVASYLLVRSLDFRSRYRSIRGVAFDISCALLLILCLVPFQAMKFENINSRLPSLVSTEKTNGSLLWIDLVEYLENLQGVHSFITDNATNYVLVTALEHKGLSRPKERWQSKNNYFDGDYQDKLLYYGVDDKLLIINNRDGAISTSGQVSGHWPADILKISKTYPPDLLEFIDRRSQDFRLIWENNGIFIYRILRNPIHYD